MSIALRVASTSSANSSSAASPMAEYAGSDAVTVDPYDVASIREGIARSTNALRLLDMVGLTEPSEERLM